MPEFARVRSTDRRKPLSGKGTHLAKAWYEP
jgi:hypothetical protein